MKLVMYLKRMLLGVVVAAIPVFITACYGPVYTYSGYVTDSETGDGVPNIKVSCIVSDNWSTIDVDEGYVSKALTNYSGYYGVSYDCDILQFKDVDGAENGQYMKKTVFINFDRKFTGDVELKRLDD